MTDIETASLAPSGYTPARAFTLFSLAVLIGALLASFFYLKSLPVLDGVVLALVGGGLGQVGDLGESMIKRSFNVKDSGGIVPGHGGILDRVDALMVTAIATYLYVLFVRMP